MGWSATAAACARYRRAAPGRLWQWAPVANPQQQPYLHIPPQLLDLGLRLRDPVSAEAAGGVRRFGVCRFCTSARSCRQCRRRWRHQPLAVLWRWPSLPCRATILLRRRWRAGGEGPRTAAGGHKN